MNANQESLASALNDLEEEYQQWILMEGLPHIPVDAMNELDTLTEDQRVWLDNWGERWNDAGGRWNAAQPNFDQNGPGQ